MDRIGVRAVDSPSAPGSPLAAAVSILLLPVRRRHGGVGWVAVGRLGWKRWPIPKCMWMSLVPGDAFSLLRTLRTNTSTERSPRAIW